MCNTWSICNIPLKCSIWHTNLLMIYSLETLKLDPSVSEALPDPECLGSPWQQKDAPCQLSWGGPCRGQPELLLLVGPFAPPGVHLQLSCRHQAKACPLARNCHLQGCCCPLLLLELRTGMSVEPMLLPSSWRIGYFLDKRLIQMFGFWLALGNCVHKHARNMSTRKQTRRAAAC